MLTQLAYMPTALRGCSTNLVMLYRLCLAIGGLCLVSWLTLYVHVACLDIGQ